MLMKRGGQIIDTGILQHQSQKLEYFEVNHLSLSSLGYMHWRLWNNQTKSLILQVVEGIPRSRTDTIMQRGCLTPECYLHCPNLTIDVYFMRNQELTKELNAPPPGSKDLYFQTQYSQPSLTQTKACVLKQYWSKWRYPQDNAIWFLTTIFASCLITHQFFPDMESSADDNCVGDGRGGAGLGFPETHRLGLKFCQSDGTTGSTGSSGALASVGWVKNSRLEIFPSRIPAKVESGGSSGEAAFVDATEPIGSVPTEMDDPTSQDVKKALLA
ncbi:hypothetical protein YC2023_059048 [Brassica napus]|uniref:(rape) hypothetical protein n=1 Tax=Brassica napus TaxID=3708 RepID=A0A816KYK4_BRANA|nr:unnamed protein product [Brassica napus]